MFDPEAAVVESLTSGTLRVPPYPAVAMRLNTLLSNPNYAMTDVIKTLGADPALAARVVGSANSAALRGTAQEISSLSDAVARIGSRQLSRLCLASGVADAACQAGPLQELKFLIWRQSLCCAFVAQQLAPMRSLDSEQAFLVGLLQGFGSTIVLGALEEVSARQPQQTVRSQNGWLQIVARHQATAAAYLAKQWELPQAIAGELGRASGQPTPMHALVVAARAVVSLMEREPGLGREQLREVLSAEAEVDAICALLPDLPGVVSALAGGDTGSRSTAVQMILRSSTLRAPELAEAFPVRVPKAHKTIEYRGAIADRQSLVLQGPEALQQNWLSKMQLGVEPPLDLWLKVTRCAPADGAYGIEAQPFALNGPLQERWAALVQAAGKS